MARKLKSKSRNGRRRLQSGYLRSGKRYKRAISFAGELANALTGEGVGGAIAAAINTAVAKEKKHTYGGEAVIRKANKVFIGKKRRFKGLAKVKRLLNPPFIVSDQVDSTNYRNAEVYDWRVRPPYNINSLNVTANAGIDTIDDGDLSWQIALRNEAGKQGFTDQIFFPKQWVYRAYQACQMNKMQPTYTGSADGGFSTDGQRLSIYLEKLWLKRTFLNTSNAVAKMDVYVLQPTQHWNMLDLRDKQTVVNGGTPLFYYNDFCCWPVHTLNVCYQQSSEVNNSYNIVPGGNVPLSGMPDAVEASWVGDYLDPHVDPLRGPWSKVFKKYFKVIKHNYFALNPGEQKDFKLTQHMNKLVDATTFIQDNFDRNISQNNHALDPNKIQLFNYPGVTKFLMVRLRSQMAFNNAVDASGITMAQATIQWVDNFGMSLRPVPGVTSGHYNFADMTLPTYQELGIVNVNDLGEVVNEDYDGI